MPITFHEVTSAPTVSIQADLTELNTTTQWIKDAGAERWVLPQTVWRFAGQISAAIIFTDFDFSAIPDTAIIHSIECRIYRELLRGLFTPQDIEDHAVVMTTEAGAQPKPHGYNRAGGNLWPPGVGRSSYSMLQNEDSANSLTVADLKASKFGFLFACATRSGRLTYDLAISDPDMVITYLEQT